MVRQVALLVLVASLAGCGGRSDTDAGTDAGRNAGVDAGADGGSDAGQDGGGAVLRTMTPAELNAALQNKDFLLIDVHIPPGNHIAGTDTRIAYNNTAALVAFIGTDLDRKVVLTCLSGSMSDFAGTALAARGYRNVWHLAGGTTAWVAAGFTLVP